MGIEIISAIAFVSFMIGFMLGRLTAHSKRVEGSFIDTAPQPPKELTAEIMEKIKDRIKRDKKIEAIKLYREVTGVGLREAKETIDRMADDS
jgi:ribosomal protein L7/L12